MGINAYQIFITVAECGNISAASSILFLTPSALSHSISKLEKDLNVNLFIRDKKGVKLTEDGKKLLEHARKIVEEERQLLIEAANLAHDSQGSISIGAMCSVCTWWLPEIVDSFKKLYPNITVIIHQGGYQKIVEWLNEGIIDIGFIPQPLAVPFDYIQLHQEMLMCVVPTSYKVKNKEYVTPQEIKNWTLVNQANVNNIDTAIFLKRHELSLNSQFFIEDDQSILAIVEKGLGFSIMPELVIKNITRDVTTYPFKPAEHRIICLAKVKNTNTPPLVKKMKNHIIDYLINNNIMNI